MRYKLLDRYKMKVKLGPNGCWLWLGATVCGHAQMYVDGGRDNPVRVYVHRWTYERVFGKIPDDHDLHHDIGCSKRCVNPTHLIPITRPEHTRLSWDLGHLTDRFGRIKKRRKKL